MAAAAAAAPAAPAAPARPGGEGVTLAPPPRAPETAALGICASARLLARRPLLTPTCTGSAGATAPSPAWGGRCLCWG